MICFPSGVSAMRKVFLFIAVFSLLGLGLALILHNALAVFLGPLIVAGCPLGYARLVGRGRKPSMGLYWRGYVSFTETSLLADRELFPDIRRRKRSGGFGRSGLSSGK